LNLPALRRNPVRRAAACMRAIRQHTIRVSRPENRVALDSSLHKPRPPTGGRNFEATAHITIRTYAAGALMASLDVLLLPLGSDEIDELPYLNREQLAEAFDMVARVNKGEAIGSSPLADLVNHVHTKNKVPANYFQMTPAQQQRWARRSYRQTARAWKRRGQLLLNRRIDRPRPRVKASLAVDRRKQIRRDRVFQSTAGPPRSNEIGLDARLLSRSGGRFREPWARTPGLSAFPRAPRLSPKNPSVGNREFSRAEFLRPAPARYRDRIRELDRLAADYFGREIGDTTDLGFDDCDAIWRDAARSRVPKSANPRNSSGGKR
jgi:hypothetical protein